MPAFIPGRELARRYYIEVVRPILEAHAPGLPHSAGLLGSGSEVLGFDTAMSTDHSWGPRVQVFLTPDDHTRWALPLYDALANELPFTFGGYSTHFEAAPDEPGTLLPRPRAAYPLHHRVEMLTLEAFLPAYAGLAPDRAPTVSEWLRVPEQILRTLADGAVYHDGLDVLAPLRRRLAWYPRDVWLYLLAAQWQRIGQEEPFVGRAGTVGDDLGSAVIAARLVRDVMRLALLLAREYAPYAKWFGTAFARLPLASQLGPLLTAVLRADDWPARDEGLAAAYALLAAEQNTLGLTPPIPAQVGYFYNRPFHVIGGELIAHTLQDAITDLEVRALPFGLGKLDQYIDGTDALAWWSKRQPSNEFDVLT